MGGFSLFGAMGGKTGSGGARKTPVPEVDPTVLQEVLSGYIMSEDVPFAWGAYGHLKTSKAVEGNSMAACVPFLTRLLKHCPHARVPARSFVSILDSMVQHGALSRFHLSHVIWESFQIMNSLQRRYWCEKQYTKLMVLLNHVRRIKSSPVKRAQALSSLPLESRNAITEMLKLVKEEEPEPPSDQGLGPGLSGSLGVEPKKPHQG